VVVTTEEMDRSWCHTVGYLSPVLAGVVLAAKLTGSRVDGRAVRALLDVTEDARGAAALAAGLTGTDRLIVAGSGPDLVSARELALKVSEGARLPAQALDVETILHGHLAAATRWTGLVLVAADAGAGDLVRTRIERLLSASATLAMPVAGILAEPLARDFASELTPAGRLVVPRMGRVKGVASTLLGAVIPFQLLAERLARARGVNPDTLGREDEAQAAAHA
jgi:fructoselysine-6-P-deglycase FrlB-like protein